MCPVRHGIENRKRRQFAASGFIVAAALAGTVTLACAAAQQDGPVVIGGSGAPDVQVDMGAVEGGGGPFYGVPLPSQGGRQLLMPNSHLTPKAQSQVMLKPPKGMSSGAAKAIVLKPPKQQAATAPAEGAVPEMAETTPPVTMPATPPEPPKLVAEPPKPKKRLPVEGEALAPAGEKASPGAPEPPPEPPPPSTGTAKAAASASGKAQPKTAGMPASTTTPPESKTATAGSETPPPPPPPPGGTAGESAATQPAPPSTQVATVGPGNVPGAAEKAMPIPFASGSATIADPEKQTLASVAQTLNSNADLRLQIVAYASGGDDNASQARRLSLSRALAVRSYLIDSGVRSTRMDVRALGNKFDAGPGDRVDLIVVKP